MASTWTWTAPNGTSADWSTPGDWTSVGAGGLTYPGPTPSGAKINILGTNTYTITVNSETETLGGTAGYLDINDPNATLAINSVSPTPAGIGEAGTLELLSGQILMSGSLASITATTGTIDGLIKGVGTLAAYSNALPGTWTVGSGGTIEASGGTLDIGGNVYGTNGHYLLTIKTGTLVVDSGSTLKLDSAGALSGTTSIGFNVGTSSGTLVVNGSTIGSYFSGSGTSASPYVFDATTTLVIANGATAASYIDIINVGTTGLSASIVNSDTIQVIDNSETYDIVNSGNLSGVHVSADTVNDGFLLYVCYAAGTHILTENGEVPVEALQEGTRVMTLAGGQLVPQPVTWVGHRRLDLAAHPQPALCLPVRIRRGALGPDLPHRDLVVSPDHSLYLNGRLVPAKLLINDMTIVQERDTRFVTYYHVELAQHAILFAEGLPAESYLDTGNRAFFSNAGLAVVLHPEFTINAGLKCWETDACAPLTVDAAAVKPVWETLAQRAEELGYQRPDPVLTDTPDLAIEADGRTIRPLSAADNRYVFALPAGVTSARLTSRASVPSYFEAYLDDWRKLGVAVRRIVLRSGADQTEIPPDHPGLTHGWHAVEQDDATSWRWMDGNAVLPIRTQAPTLVEIHVAIAMRHAVEDAAPVRLAA